MKYIVIFFIFSPTSNHLHSLQVVNCGSNSRLIVDGDVNGKFRLERVNPYSAEIFVYRPWRQKVCFFQFEIIISASSQKQGLTQRGRAFGSSEPCVGRCIHVLSLFLLVSLYSATYFHFNALHINLSQLFPLHLNTYVMGSRPLQIFKYFQRGDHRRHILTYKNGHCAERVKKQTAFPLQILSLFWAEIYSKI